MMSIEDCLLITAGFSLGNIYFAITGKRYSEAVAWFTTALVSAMFFVELQK